MPAPINVKLEGPANPQPNWIVEKNEWLYMNVMVHGNSGFFPLTIKAAYVVGIMHDLCKCVEHLLQAPDARNTTYIPAFGVFASAVDLLGRCLQGNWTTYPRIGSSTDLSIGLKWLLPNDSLVTRTRVYTAEDLTQLRHFASHGQATANIPLHPIDSELFSALKPEFAVGLNGYWHKLLAEDAFCEQLALANIFRLRPLPLFKSWVLFDENLSVQDIFNRFNWDN